MPNAHASDVIEALEARFNPPRQPRAWATFTEVTDGAQRRRIDFLAVHTWQSRGRMIHGVEVKVKRADWIKELRSPKADSWFSVADAWYLAAPQGVVEEGELPSTWGFLELRKTKDGWKLHEKVKAPALDHDAATPWWLVQRLLARGEDRRKASDPELVAAKAETYRQAYDAGKQAGQMLLTDDRSARKELTELLETIGGSELGWRSQEHRIALIRRAVSMIDSGRMENMARRSSQLFREAADAIDTALANGGVVESKDDLF